MRALVLSGGSVKGCFQAGAIAEVLTLGFAPDAVYGTSVGSLNGSFLVERAGRAAVAGKSPDWPEIGRQLENFWLSRIDSFSKIGRRHGLLKLVWLIARGRFDGFVDNSRLRRLVAEEIKLENLRRSPIAFSACAVNIAGGDLVYGRPDDANILDYIIASTGIPLTMPVTMIGHQPFLDGGLREVAPLKVAVEEGATEIVCVVCQAEKIGCSTFDPKRIMELVDRLMGIGTNEMVNNDLNVFGFINENTPKDGKPEVEGPFVGKRHIPIAVIRPDKPLALSLEHFTHDDIVNALSAGRATARKVLRGGTQPPLSAQTEAAVC
jgi:NTE family protein